MLSTEHRTRSTAATVGLTIASELGRIAVRSRSLQLRMPVLRLHRGGTRSRNRLALTTLKNQIYISPLLAFFFAYRSFPLFLLYISRISRYGPRSFGGS